uniref:EGF-like domain-containing protein n=1 Tax=Syphacia muris TaxID=451379 RepID=A0A158R519_9BILA
LLSECLTGSEFKCLNGKCIPISWRCDGDRDCANDEDEMHCDNLVCNNTEDFRCSSDNSGLPFYCIPKSWVCDGEPDCKDGSDENSCTDGSYYKGVIIVILLHNEIIICWLYFRYISNKFLAVCKEDQFSCMSYDGRSRICLPIEWKCDGSTDCKDGIDEQNCTDVKKCADDEFFVLKCATDNICIPHSWVCDGEHDCPDRSDEINCNSSQHRQPYHHESRCRSQTQCINKSWVCDGDVDCYDGSDEENCNFSSRVLVFSGQPVKCGLNEKQCNHGACLPEKKWCDGVEDCIDGSDEKDCINVECDQWQYKCPGTPLECINLDSLCVDNGNNNDCVSSVCSKNIIAMTQLAFHFTDIDECQSFGVCPQKCINTDGGYRCECYPGYRYHERKTKSGTVSLCRAIGSDPFILLSNRATIRGFDLYQKKYKTLVASVESAVAMDFLHRTGTLIWSDVSSEKIFMCQMGKEKTLHEAKNCESNQNELVLIDKDIVTPDGLAIDWVHELLFWTDAGLNQINVLDLVSRKRRTLFNDGLDEPRAIAVDPSRGLIFWSDWGLNARIERAGMDGSNRKAIISGDKIQWPNGIALDIMDRHIFWADAKLKIIMTCDYDGQGVKLILRSHDLLRHPFSLAVFEDRLYWTDWDSDGVVAANKYNGKEIMRGVSGPMTVRVYHEAVQPNHPNKCQNHDCHHLCLPRPHLPNRFVILHIDNPVYRRTVEEVDGDVEAFTDG